MSRLLRALLGVLALATAVPLPGELCSAADRVITSVDPANVVQGDTVLLTIKGENLPGGTVVVSFFPQQIAVLKVLSASPTEVSVQVKVPSLAPPGSYNIVIYNHLGDEAFAPGVRTGCRTNCWSSPI